MCVPFIPSINNCNLSFLCSLIWFTLSTSETEREPTRPRLAFPRPRLPPSLAGVLLARPLLLLPLPRAPLLLPLALDSDCGCDVCGCDGCGCNGCGSCVCG